MNHGLMVQICVFLPTVGGDCANLHPDSRKPRVTNPKSVHVGAVVLPDVTR